MKKLLLILFVFYSPLISQELINSMIGSAFTENKSYDFLETVCDEAGGRLMGTENNLKALEILRDKLLKIGIESKLEKFKVPGWFRGNDKVIVKLPYEKELHAAALGYTEKTASFEAEVIYANYGFEEDFKKYDFNEKIALVTQENPPGKSALLRYEIIINAANAGAKAVLFINNKNGAVLLTGVSNFEGKPAAVPAFSITYEDGQWMRRSIENKNFVKVYMEVNSYCKETESSNTVVSFKGEADGKIVVGAHFDSWDISQGAVDNGVGSAILFDVARLLKKYSEMNYYSIDLVWFNGEELGLWGSKKYVEMHKNENIIAMINMDMTGSPRGFNAMGFDEFIPFLEELNNNLAGFELKSGVISRLWTNSDHMPFAFAGIPTITPMGHLEEDMVKYYHAEGDSFDKVSIKYLSEAAAAVSVLVYKLTNYTKLETKRRTKEEVIELLRSNNLEDRLRRQKEWIFD